jgi:hypothetical protein
MPSESNCLLQISKLFSNPLSMRGARDSDKFTMFPGSSKENEVLISSEMCISFTQATSDLSEGKAKGEPVNTS